MEAKEPFTDDQILWLVDMVELQQNLIDAGNVFIEELRVANFRKDLDLHELSTKINENTQQKDKN
jgi:hypothetical protein